MSHPNDAPPTRRTWDALKRQDFLLAITHFRRHPDVEAAETVEAVFHTLTQLAARFSRTPDEHLRRDVVQTALCRLLLGCDQLVERVVNVPEERFKQRLLGWLGRTVRNIDQEMLRQRLKAPAGFTSEPSTCSRRPAAFATPVERRCGKAEPRRPEKLSRADRTAMAEVAERLAPAASALREDIDLLLDASRYVNDKVFAEARGLSRTNACRKLQEATAHVRDFMETRKEPMEALHASAIVPNDHRGSRAGDGR